MNQKREKKQLFTELKKYSDGGVTKKELKSVLAGLKYGSDDYFSVSEVNELAKELNLGKISKKHLAVKSLSHISKIDCANHNVNYSSKNSINKVNDARVRRNMLNDDVIHFEVQKGIEKVFGKKYKNIIVDGDMMFEDEREEIEFFDSRTGKRFFGRSSQLKRPRLHLKNQSSLRGRGLIAGKKNL